RTLGPPLVIVAAVFLTYVFFGDAAWVPDAIRWAGASLNKAMGHMMLTEEGVFGIALGVSTKFVFLFVLFGSLLDKAGAGNYFIQVAFSLLGHLRGGPAKAAVVASGMTGLISGSSIANVVTTGTFTVPLMKRVGFSSEKAGAVEVASSVNGQIMPPVMGAAAFLMVEYIGIPYTDVIRHAFLPAVISYIALIYIVHLEAMKAGMQGLEKRPDPRSTSQRLLAWGIIVCSILIVAGGTYFIVETLKPILGAIGPWFFGSVLMAVYVGLVWFGAQYPELGMDDPNSEIVTLPEVGPTVKSGLHFILPIVVLVWCLMIERLSPALSAFWAAAFMIVIILTQRPLFALFRGRGALGGAGMQGLEDLFNGLVTGARNMIGIGIATATAGIIVGTVTLTGVGLVLANFVEILSGGQVLIMLILVAVLSLILGMGLPTTANYIVVSSLMAPVVVALGAKSGLIVPLIAVHLFVFYFGIMADVTPPVGLASFAAAAVSGGDPIKTGFTAFFYSMRTAALPFIFIFNTELLLIGITGPVDLVITVVTATIAMLVFAA
ncbi:MAG: TRAP transporter fused permease subunit, partial [Pseudomonadota bacterium]